MSAIAILTKAEILAQKINQRQFMDDEHLEKHKSEMQELFQMTYTTPDYGYPEDAIGYQTTSIVGNVDWRLNVDADDARRASISELWLGKSSINQNEWHFLPPNQQILDDIDPDRVFIVKNFMIIRFMGGEGWKYLFLNLLSKKIFWVREDELKNKIA